MAKLIERSAGLRALRLAEELVVRTNHSALSNNTDNIRVVPNLSLGIPNPVAIQIASEKDGRTAEPLRMRHERLINQPDVAFGSPVTHFASPHRKQGERLGCIDRNGYDPILVRLMQGSYRQSLAAKYPNPLERV